MLLAKDVLEDQQDVSNEAKTLLEVVEVFPIGLPSGLPPKRSIQHYIDLYQEPAYQTCHIRECLQKNMKNFKTSGRVVAEGTYKGINESICSSSTINSKERWYRENVP